MSNIRKFLDISTGHLPPSERDRIDDGEVPITSHAHPEGYGWFVYVPQEPSDWPNIREAAPALARCLEHARKLDCDYILFDSDACIDEQLPWYGDHEFDQRTPPDAASPSPEGVTPVA